MLQWSTPVQYLPMVGPVYAKRLEKLEIRTFEELLWHMPFRYENYSHIVKIGHIKENEVVTVIGTVTKSQNQYLRNRKQIQKIILADETGEITATWFNQPFIVNTIKEGVKLAISGRAGSFGFNLQFESPEYELIRVGKPLIHTARLVPVYPETAGVSSKWLRSRIAPLLEFPLVKNDYLPLQIKEKNNLLGLDAAFKNVHFPLSLESKEIAKHRLAFDELFLLQLANTMRRKEWHNQKIVTPFKIFNEKLDGFFNSLPFTLTNSQKRVVKEILSDLQKGTPMNRLLEGDVGSGKTVVAAIAAYTTYLNGKQTLFMAPTEILAEQHYETLNQLLTPFGIKVEILTGSRRTIESGIKNNELRNNNHHSSFIIHHSNIVVGTHALLEKKVQLSRVGLIVIDEQHRFGVKQRAMLREKGASPHVLTMTATPIPRTIALTIYGDLELSTLNEMPKNRIAVKTWVVPHEKRIAAYAWIKKKIIESDHQDAAFIVCPFIDPSESLKTVKAATEEFHKLQTIFVGCTVALLHGKMSGALKQQTLLGFKNGQIDILVCTPVVEVGIDISRATIMLIEAAERFGLAQLHQLRGRVGRSHKQSFCLLFTSEKNTESLTRLKALERTQSGLQLAEFDLKLRGPGDIYGTAQHGQQLLKVASLTNMQLIEKTKEEAQKHLASDPDLTQNPLLKELVRFGTIGEIAPD